MPQLRDTLPAHPQGYILRAISNVLVATPTTLLTSLVIVRQLWRFEDQNKHTAELANRAERFYSRAECFLGMQDVGKQLDKAKGSYGKVSLSFTQVRQFDQTSRRVQILGCVSAERVTG